MDDVSTQLLRDTRLPQAAMPGQVQRVDVHDARAGVVKLLVFCEPWCGQRWVSVTARRTTVDWAHPIKDLVDVRYPHAERRVLVINNVNTHGPAWLYEVVAPTEAKRFADKREIHPTPTHGSWRTMAEIELSGLSRQCLHRRVPDAMTRIAEVPAWERRRNAAGGSINWRFTTADAPIKLTKLYPAIQE
jgi:hypothetical protein